MKLSRISAVAALLLAPTLVMAADPVFKMSLKDHRFEPAEITVAAGQKFTIILTNHDATPEEFDSRKLQREKVVAGGKTGKINLGPLEAGEYPFMGEYNAASAQGKVIVK